MTVLVIAGHGKARSGRVDPGATGIISKGEHRYMVENLFPAMKKYVGDADVVFFTDYDVYDHGNIVELARKYGKDTIVIEFHYDAGVPEASGGHVIVKFKFKADTLDLRLRDAINGMVGVRYSHNGAKGISGRDNLANVNRTAQSGVNYRLVELGFGTNKKDADVLIHKTDEYAKKLVEAILNKDVVKEPVKEEPVKNPVSNPQTAKKSNAEIAKDVIAGKFGNGDARKTNIERAGYNFNAVQAEVNKILNVKPVPVKKSNVTIANEVIKGSWGSGNDRKVKLERAGYNYNAIQNEVNRLLGANNRKSDNAIANEVIAGKWGNGANRNAKLKQAGYNVNEIQRLVNQKLK